MNTQRRPRLLTPLNETFLFLAQAVNGNSCEVLELDEAPDPALLERALQAAMARHPALCSRLRRRGLDTQWEVVDGPESPVSVHWHELRDADAEACQKHVLANVWSQPLDLERERPARFHVTTTDRGAILQLVTSHVWSDARAGYRFANDVCETYTAIAEGVAPDVTAIDIPDRDSGVLLAEAQGARADAYRRQSLRLLREELSGGTCGLRLPRRRGRNDLRRIDLGERFLADLRVAAHRRKATVHGLITAALMRACRDHDRAHGIEQPRTHQIHDMFSLRRFAGEAAMELYDTFVIPFDVRLNTGDDVDELVGKAMGALNELKAGGVFVEYHKLRWLLRGVRVLPRRAAVRLLTGYLISGNVICTNPGPIPYPIERLGAIAVRDFYSFSQLFPPGRVMCVFNTFRRRLRLTVIYDQAAFPEGIEAELTDNLLRHLREIVNAGQSATEVAADALA